MKLTEEFSGFTSIKKNRNSIVCSRGQINSPQELGYREEFLVMRQDGKEKFKIGDIRIKYSVVPCPEATVCMRQNQDGKNFNFTPHYEVETPKPEDQISNGGIL